MSQMQTQVQAETPRIDRYTKTVLTVIAGCLLFQCAMTVGNVVEARQQPGPSTQAGVVQIQPQPVVIVGWDATALERQPPLPVQIARGDSPLPVALAAPVRLAYTADNPLPAAINGIRRAGPWEAINAHVDPQPRDSIPVR